MKPLGRRRTFNDRQGTARNPGLSAVQSSDPRGSGQAGVHQSAVRPALSDSRRHPGDAHRRSGEACRQMSEPTLSVIIPAWNEEKYVGRAIDSLKHAASVYERERGCTAEIIVVDNNSSDKTGDIARQHGVQVVHEPVNNIGKARNAGVKAARGKYIAFCDADNQVTENLLVLIHDHLEDPKIAGGGTWIEPANHNLKIDFFYTLWGIYVRASRVGVGMMHCRREDFWSFNGFDETIYAAEDVQLAY